MFRRRLFGIATVVLAAASLLLLPGTSEAQRGRGGVRGSAFRGGAVYRGGPVYRGGAIYRAPIYRGGIYRGGFYRGYGGYYGGLGLLGFGGLGLYGYGGYYPYGGLGGYYSGYSYPSYGSGYSYPYGYSNYYSPSYNYYTPSYSYAVPPSDYAFDGTPATDQSFYPSESTAQDNDVHIQVDVPSPDAQVWFEGTPTQQKGTVREFESPPLTPGQNYTYHIRARWTENGQVRDQTRNVVVQAGQHVAVDFLAPDSSAATANNGQRDQQAQPVQPAVNTSNPAAPAVANPPGKQQPVEPAQTPNPKQ
jgi:uncharacterized protein (TIGR03000 family)